MQRRYSGLGVQLAASAALLTVGGLTVQAASPGADEKIAVARAALQHAEQSGAPQSAPVELAAARDKLSRAEKARSDRDSKSAALLAEQANIDAQVAEAAALQQKSHAAAVEFDSSMQALRSEAIRSTPAQ